MRFTWANLSDFLQNNIPTTYSQLQTQPNAHYRETVFGAYIQDDVRFRSNLTINLGLRYEMMREPTTADFNTTTQTPQFAHFIHLYTDPTEYLGYPYFNNPTKRNFSHRVWALVWDPFKDGKTSIRAGFGISDVLPLQYQWRFNASGAAPWSETFACSGAPLTANVFPDTCRYRVQPHLCLTRRWHANKSQTQLHDAVQPRDSASVDVQYDADSRIRRLARCSQPVRCKR